MLRHLLVEGSQSLHSCGSEGGFRECVSCKCANNVIRRPSENGVRVRIVESDDLFVLQEHRPDGGRFFVKANVLGKTGGKTVKRQIQATVSLIAHIVMTHLGEKGAVGSGKETRLDVLRSLGGYLSNP